MNTSIYLTEKSNESGFSLEATFEHPQEEKTYEVKRIFSEQPKDARFHFLSLINEALEQAKNEGINRIILIPNTRLLKAFLSDISKKRLKALDESLAEEGKKVIRFKKMFVYVGYRYEAPKNKNIQKSIKLTEEKYARKMTPPHFDYTSYTDVSVKDKRCLLAGIIYDKNGVKIHEFRKESEKEANTTYLEAQAIYENMKAARNLKLNNILFRTDCDNVLTLQQQIRANKTRPLAEKRNKKHYQMVQFINEELSKNSTWELERIKRQLNRFAHQLTQRV